MRLEHGDALRRLEVPDAHDALRTRLPRRQETAAAAQTDTRHLWRKQVCLVSVNAAMPCAPSRDQLIFTGSAVGRGGGSFHNNDNTIITHVGCSGFRNAAEKWHNWTMMFLFAPQKQNATHSGLFPHT